MSDRRGGLLVLLVGTATLIAAVVLALAWADRDRAITAGVPQPSPLYSTPVITVRPDQVACLSRLTILPDSEVAHVRIGTLRKPSVPVTAWVTGPRGYRSQDRIPASAWKDNDLLAFHFEPPQRPIHGRFCLRNDGRRRVDVYAANDRSQTIARQTVDRRPQAANIQLSFTEAQPGTITGHADRIMQSLSVFRPGFVGPWLLWPLAVLAVVGLPAGLAWAMWRAVRDDGAG